MILFSMVSTRASREYTYSALKSFRACTRLRSTDKVIVVDNDGSFDPPISETWYSVLRNETPLSFAANANGALTHAFPHRADVILLNNDLLFCEGWLEPILSPERAILSPVSNREVTFTAQGFTFSNVLTLSEVEGKEQELLHCVRKHRENSWGPQTVIALPFFCVRIPYIVYSEVGLFDLSYGVGGGEDYDYCLRAALKDIPVRYFRQSFVLHFNGKSTWHGVGESQTPSDRVARYSAHFESRWGKYLRRLLIDEDHSVLREIPAAQEAFNRNDIKEGIRILQGTP